MGRWSPPIPPPTALPGSQILPLRPRELVRGLRGHSDHLAGNAGLREVIETHIPITRFEQAHPGGEHHHHLICGSCGKGDTFDDAALDVFKRLGINLIPVDLPDVPYDAMRIILTAEAAAAFDDLTRSNRDNELVQQGKFDWPNTFRTSRFIPAVDYVNANRLRSIAIQKWDDLMRTVDVIVTPTGAANLSQLVATNLTGHPAVILPNGFRDDGTPVSLTFLGGLFEESKLLAVARAYQEATGFHLKHPVVPLTPSALPAVPPPAA